MPTIIKLRSSDGKLFEVKTEVAMKFGTIKGMAEAGCTDFGEAEIALPNVDTWELDMSLKWATHHYHHDHNHDHDQDHDHKLELKRWDSEFLKDMDLSSVHHLLLAANYLNAAQLIDTLAEKVASYIRGKTTQQVRDAFGIANRFAPEQEDVNHGESTWTFD